MGWGEYRAGECSWDGGLVKRGDFKGVIRGWFTSKCWNSPVNTPCQCGFPCTFPYLVTR